MMHAVRGIYRGGIVELLEIPEIAGDAEVVVTFLGTLGSPTMAEGSIATSVDKAELLEDLEPIVPIKPIRLSDLVLEGRE